MLKCSGVFISMAPAIKCSCTSSIPVIVAMYTCMTSLNCLLFCLKLETYYIILVNNLIDLLVCTLFGSELATEITLAGLK